MERSRYYQGNMAALVAFQPDVARAVEAVPIPNGVTAAKGRDGSDTFLIATQNGRRVWFGQSSMPTISAPEMFAGFHGDGGSVALPGILTGLEPLVLAGKMPPYCAVFVVEEDPLQIKLAMCLRDYVGLISAGRLVFLAGRDLEAGLRAFLDRHPGYVLPTRLVHVPHRSAAQIADSQRQLENAGEAAANLVARSVESYAKVLGGRTFGLLPETPRIALIGSDPRGVSLEQAARVRRALGKLGWPHEPCVPDAPNKCHVLARLQAIERVSADLVLMVNAPAGPLQSLLPPGLPIVSWYGVGSSAHAMANHAQKPHHLVFASSRAVQAQLVEAGVRPDLIELCEPAADDVMYRPVTLTPEELNAWSADVAVLTDLPDDRPEASDVVLESQVALWRALQAIVRQKPDRYHDETAGGLLDEAQSRSGTTLNEATIREHFIALLKARIAPAGMARAAVDALVADGRRVSVWGAGWSGVSGGKATVRGAIPRGEELNRLFNATSIVVLPESSPWAVQTTLDALAAGAHAFCRPSAGSLSDEYPGLADCAPHLHAYHNLQDLTRMVRSTRERSAAAAAPDHRAETARSVVLEGHTVCHRLQAIVDRVRKRQAASVENPGSAVNPRCEEYEDPAPQ